MSPGPGIGRHNSTGRAPPSHPPTAATSEQIHPPTTLDKPLCCKLYFSRWPKRVWRRSMSEESRIKSLGERLFELREERGWSQSQLAVEAGLSHVTVTHVE